MRRKQRQLARQPFDRADRRRLARVGEGAGIGQAALVIGLVVGIAHQPRRSRRHVRQGCSVLHRALSFIWPGVQNDFSEPVRNQPFEGVGQLGGLRPAGPDLNRGSARGCQHQKPHDQSPETAMPSFATSARGVMRFDHLDELGRGARVQALFVDDLQAAVPWCPRRYPKSRPPTSRLLMYFRPASSAASTACGYTQGAGFGKLDQQRQVGAVDDAPVRGRAGPQRQVRGRAAEHVGHHHHAVARYRRHRRPRRSRSAWRCAVMVILDRDGAARRPACPRHARRPTRYSRASPPCATITIPITRRSSCPRARRAARPRSSSR